ncbi:DUF84 family protein [Peribacillus kribbensis]|uniref:DUF84 family protein n=1 Tax=Peribacillus kribbensis TaxID=356658 RepID=UPI0004290E6A|nr:DUF84 family protein [Peribacillus kribbensis]
MKKAAIGSKNPMKVKAVKDVLDEFEILSMEAKSGVSEQPLSDEETITGAINRAKQCVDELQAEIGFGLEGGVLQTERGVFLCNWGALASKGGEVFIAGGARIPLPEEIGKRLMNGEELGPIMNDYTERHNVSKKEGAIGVFTNERIVRSDMFSHIVSLLLGQYEYSKKLNHG